MIYFVRLLSYLKLNTPLNKTWHWEALFVALILIVTGMVSDKGYKEWIGVLAVFFTFMHASVAERLSESEGYRKTKGEHVYVDCFYKLPIYFYAKEICFFFYFFSLGAWSALTGVIIFLIYPYWRKAWRKFCPSS